MASAKSSKKEKKKEKSDDDPCDEDKIWNPRTKRCVKLDSVMGQKILNGEIKAPDPIVIIPSRLIVDKFELGSKIYRTLYRLKEKGELKTKDFYKPLSAEIKEKVRNKVIKKFDLEDLDNSDIVRLNNVIRDVALKIKGDLDFHKIMKDASKEEEKMDKEDLKNVFSDKRIRKYVKKQMNLFGKLKRNKLSAKAIIFDIGSAKNVPTAQLAKKHKDDNLIDRVLEIMKEMIPEEKKESKGGCTQDCESEGKICNEFTGRCVSVSGKKGKEILEAMDEKERKAVLRRIKKFHEEGSKKGNKKSSKKSKSEKKSKSSKSKSSKSSSEKSKKPKCPKGYRRNKKTGKCEEKKD